MNEAVPKITAPAEDENADILEMTVAELAVLETSLEDQIAANRASDPHWVAELEKRLQAAKTRIVELNQV